MSRGLENQHTATPSIPCKSVPGFERWKYQDRSDRVVLSRVVEEDDGPHISALPMWVPTVRRVYARGSEILVELPSVFAHAQPITATLTDLTKGEGITRAGCTLTGTALKAAGAALLEIATTMTVTTISPSIIEAWPPLAPECAPAHDDEDAARKAWGWLGQQLTPLGRLVVGMALMSPYHEASGGEAGIVSLWGLAGSGKSALGRACAALFGNPAPQQGLMRALNAAPIGLMAWLQELSYLPPILDELQSATSDPEAQMISIVTGAARMRAERTGVARKDDARWAGIAFVTSNAPVPATHEMWSRRLIEVSGPDLWRDDADDDFWADVHRMISTHAGWPWNALAREYGPGARARQWADAIAGLAMPCRSSLGRMLRIGYVGTAWLTDWTGTDWDAGVWDAAVALGAERLASVTDPSAAAAEALLATRLRTDEWADLADPLSRRPVIGWPAQEMKGISCGIGHDAHCIWVDQSTDSVTAAIGDTRRLSRTAFRRAIHAPEAGHLTRKVRRAGSRQRVMTWCVEGMGCLMEEAPPAPVIPSTPARPQSEAVVYGWSTDDNLARALDDAVANGVTRLVLGGRLTADMITDAGWDPQGWTGAGTGSGRISKGDVSLRIYRDRDPEQYCAALRDWAETTNNPVGVSIPGMTLSRLRALNEGPGRSARLRLNPTIADLIPAHSVAHPAWWKRDGQNPPADAESWDRNKSYLSAMTQAIVAPLWFGENFEVFTGSDIPDPSRQWAGLWRIIIPNWRHDLPSPFGAYAPGSRVNVTTELLLFAQEFNISCEIDRAIIAPAHKVKAIERLSNEIKGYLETFDGKPGKIIAKQMYQSFAGALEMRSDNKKRPFRPDWGWAIANNSWISTLRHAYRIEAEHGVTPLAVKTDAIIYPAGTNAGQWLPIGTGLGQFKREGE